VVKDEKAAAVWYRKAVAQADEFAQNNLGRLHAAGRGVEKDEKEAVRLFKLAAEAGLARAQNNLGVMYAGGRGVPKDEKLAEEWYDKAVAQGDANAKENLKQLKARQDAEKRTPRALAAQVAAMRKRIEDRVANRVGGYTARSSTWNGRNVTAAGVAESVATATISSSDDGGSIGLALDGNAHTVLFNRAMIEYKGQKVPLGLGDIEILAEGTDLRVVVGGRQVLPKPAK
jgi:hypothetical protein